MPSFGRAPSGPRSCSAFRETKTTTSACGPCSISADGVGLARARERSAGSPRRAFLRIDRDSTHAGPTLRETFDCLACGACCKRNEVVLNRSDVARLRRARPDLLKRPWVRRRNDGKLTLTLLRSGACRHLEQGNACAIYEHRPSPCSDFVIGSECCLSSREEEGVTSESI